MRSPQVEAATGLPPKVTIYEVGPRDGLQNEKTVVPAATKVEFIRRLEAAGLGTIETTSFVPAKWVPQMGDAEEVLAALGADGVGRRRPALVPNERGLDRAEELGLGASAIFGSATETFAQKNLNRSVTEQYAMFEPVVKRALAGGMWVRAYVSMCFGDPWEGPVPVEQVVETAERLMDLGCHELSLGDTIGVGTDRVAVHFHDTYGQALANTMAALRDGVSVVDASAGGLGGCPYAKSATGNLATEDLVWALHGAGVETGVDLRHSSRPRCGWRSSSAGRRRATSSEPSPAPERSDRPERTRLPAAGRRFGGSLRPSGPRQAGSWSTPTASRWSWSTYAGRWPSRDPLPPKAGQASSVAPVIRWTEKDFS